MKRKHANIIRVRNLNRSFRVHLKQEGMIGSLKSLVHRKWTVRHALQDVSFDVKEGEIVGLLGANGAGKTTLVKILAGIIHPDSGDASVLGYVPWERHNNFRSSIALIMGQKSQLWWDLPAADCFVLLREIYRIDKNIHRQRLQHLTDTLEVDHVMNIQMRRLSLGERMKMELIAALLHDPRAIYLDEPTIGLDTSAQRAIRNFLLEFQSEYNPAMILTSHYMEDIERLCKRIVVLRKGRIVYDGSLRKVLGDFARYKTVRAELSSPPPKKKELLPPELGILKKRDRGMIEIQAPRSKTAEAARYILNHYPVIDLVIEEEEVGVVIERIMKGGTTDAMHDDEMTR